MMRWIGTVLAIILLSSAQLRGEERVSEEQLGVERNMRLLEQRFAALIAILQSTETQRAQRLGEVLDQARRERLAERMHQAAERIAAKDFDKARRLQQIIAEELLALLDLIRREESISPSKNQQGQAGDIDVKSLGLLQALIKRQNACLRFCVQGIEHRSTAGSYHAILVLLGEAREHLGTVNETTTAQAWEERSAEAYGSLQGMSSQLAVLANTQKSTVETQLRRLERADAVAAFDLGLAKDLLRTMPDELASVAEILDKRKTLFAERGPAYFAELGDSQDGIASDAKNIFRSIRGALNAERFKDAGDAFREALQAMDQAVLQAQQEQLETCQLLQSQALAALQRVANLIASALAQEEESALSDPEDIEKLEDVKSRLEDLIERQEIMHSVYDRLAAAGKAPDTWNGNEQLVLAELARDQSAAHQRYQELAGLVEEEGSSFAITGSLRSLAGMYERLDTMQTQKRIDLRSVQQSSQLIGALNELLAAITIMLQVDTPVPPNLGEPPPPPKLGELQGSKDEIMNLLAQTRLLLMQQSAVRQGIRQVQGGARDQGLAEQQRAVREAIEILTAMSGLE